MSNQYFNFNYDPTRQGFDTSSWRTLYGSAVVGGNQLRLFNTAIVHYGDILRGDAEFNLNLSAPTIGADRKFGFISLGRNAYIYFKILNTIFTAEISDGVTAYSSVIDWQSAWTGVNTNYRIKWEAGTATFYVGETFQAALNDTYSLDIPVIQVPGDPLSLYLSNNSTDGLFLNIITVKSIQSYLMNEGNEDSSFESIISDVDRITITDVVTMAPATTMGVNVSDTVNIPDVPTVATLTETVSVVDSVSVPNVVVNITRI